MSGLHFARPEWLWLLPLLALALWLVRRRAGRARARAHALFPEAALMAGAAAAAGRAAGGWRGRGRRLGRALPALLYGAALALALTALARPRALVWLPGDRAGVVLAIETSRSMAAPDIEPSRMEATREAALGLLARIPSGTRVGLATFSGYGTLNVPLTHDRERMEEAIATLPLGGGYAFTHGLEAALAALPDVGEMNGEMNGGANEGAAPGAAAPGGAAPGVIVLFSHGHDNSGNDPLALADEAARRGIRVHTVGVGTHGNNFSDDVLKVVADRTGGRYFPIFSAGDLRGVERPLGRAIARLPRTTEVGALAALLAALLVSASLTLGHFQRRLL